jgi:hypothetical protein
MRFQKGNGHPQPTGQEVAKPPLLVYLGGLLDDAVIHVATDSLRTLVMCRTPLSETRPIAAAVQEKDRKS